MKNIIVVEDKAKNVFKYIALVSKHKGHLTLKELKAQARPANDHFGHPERAATSEGSPLLVSAPA